MMGRVKLKSNRAAFSISTAREGGAKAREEAARRERDLRVEGARDKIWSFENLRGEILGSEIWRLGRSLGEGEMVETGIRGLEEAMIMLAMAGDERDYLVVIGDLDFEGVYVSRSKSQPLRLKIAVYGIGRERRKRTAEKGYPKYLPHKLLSV